MSYWYTDDVKRMLFNRSTWSETSWRFSFRYLELFLGQFYRCGNITLWGKIAPSMKGIGIASFFIVTAVTLFYTTIIGIFQLWIGFFLTYKNLNLVYSSSCYILFIFIISRSHAMEFMFTYMEYSPMFRAHARRNTDESNRRCSYFTECPWSNSLSNTSEYFNSGNESLISRWILPYLHVRNQ